jgi:hypothetical protein
MRVKTNTVSFEKQISNIIKYSEGFLDGVQKGKSVFLKNLGAGVIEVMASYVDVSAKGNPRALHHVYEWYQNGSPNARLFNLVYVVNGEGLNITSTFKQSRSLKEDSNQPFYNKASIMENGMQVTISPKGSSPLVFESGGTTVFTKRPITVRNPGGNEVKDGFENTVDEFILKYFKQSFLRSSGIYDYIKKPTVYKRNIKAGSKMGRSKGIDTGFKWIANARIGIE